MAVKSGTAPAVVAGTVAVRPRCLDVVEFRRGHSRPRLVGVDDDLRRLAGCSSCRSRGDTACVEFVNDVVAVANDARAGRGVRLRRAVRAGEVIERCPVLVLPTDQWEQFDDTVFYGYFYAWDDDTVAFALGYGSLYNHSRTPNAEYYADFDGHCVEIVSLVDLDAGTEVLIDYTRGGTNPLWFEPLDEPAPSPQQLDVAV